ncbi:photosynthetic NDH subunit of subcomplex B 3, chloroplastic isoform X6 [Quercus robur]|uniref:photosynthetic NDH subunit of subcomplex B 3, chloroplastic isoform X1 n=1 Tax=Quercus robur TaxID=38942 RepID=UPI002162FC97|nr:photosynthetic NDH subunit of subcomplex B 3, chloroplastic isoform X1 [Quercus robur]XP_050286085.1 photosynthetic NDH subunit of subcomplex B 3, chloroplastic isoform X2 [Quercus robur]XP_050286086.1 photosynthetic NDH subunit of subcomplex B 3, chloroplastic isoform X3 [Quercus robur]XP_050286087.1 photosynthetic NDH subunit of subcomplex B 3, chloroplastic isoform X4 [Quercus robur]XP_050286090.1 photosynthetic NDH subunit of subcomplex B 3, chloroplastic isoform X6 [Quercus robur]
MGTLQLSSYALSSFSTSLNFNYITNSHKTLKTSKQPHPRFSRGKIRAVGTIPENESQSTDPEEPPFVAFAFVSSVLLPDGTPDVHFRKACGGQKLRNIMLDSNIELYGPYARPLLNCAGGGTCATCMVEIIQGKELLTPRTDKEKEKLKKKPKNWRLACQLTVGKKDSRGLLVVQQLPEWKGHEWNYERISPEELASELELNFGSESS